MTSYAVFPSLNRQLSDIYEDELYHINLMQQLSGSPQISKSLDSEQSSHSMFGSADWDVDINSFQQHQQPLTKQNSGNNIIYDSAAHPTFNKTSFFSNNNNDQQKVQPFNEYANPDLNLNDSLNQPQHQMQQIPYQSMAPFSQPSDIFSNINIYDYDNQGSDLLLAPSQKHSLNTIPSMYLHPMELPDEDLEDYDSEDDDDDEDKLDDVDDFMPNEPHFYEYMSPHGADQDYSSNEEVSDISTANTSVAPSPKPLSQNYLSVGTNNGNSGSEQPRFFSKREIFNENAIVDEEEEEDKSMELDYSDGSDDEESLYLPRFDNVGLFEKTSRSHSFVNDQEGTSNSIKQLEKSNTIKFKNGSSSISKPKHRKSVSQPSVHLDGLEMAESGSMSAFSDTNNQCMLINPATNAPCLKNFSRPYDLIRHQETIHATKKKIFRCIICETNYKKTLNNANIDPESEKPLHSPKTFSRGDALSRHIRVKHGLSGNAVADAIKYAKDNVEYVNIN